MEYIFFKVWNTPESNERKINQLRYICSWSKGTILLRCQFFFNWFKGPVQFQ